MPGWHIQLNGQSKGPYSDGQLKVLCETGALNAATLAWKSDYSSWKPLAETDFIYKSLLPPPPSRPGARSATFTSAGQAGSGLSIWGYFVRAIREKYVTFGGRARRKEYWSVVLFYMVFLVAIVIVGVLADEMAETRGHVVTVIFGALYVLALALPGLAVFVRRLHDVGLSGWLAPVAIIPYAGGLFCLVIALIPSQSEANKHGANPKLLAAS
jgi:uncharacterized membrane protein YhaH (DUF805 family)